ncbi:SAF domain-containing protein [Streptomyces sp. RB6PN25]|uniref:SAF domain-containing protein n=1 Tax=Streptomyces humicola TaxID=2953240 RepID=A0ABT1Q389_9ACTN|nr:SAF domain-containing protein [Streptomyces humicola]MCQ4084389.1 SAF domain-containing protein [Streptomyces humicola]
MWAGIGVVLVCSVGFTTVLAQAGRTVPVLEVARPVPAGSVVTAGDVRVVRLGVHDAGGEVVRKAREDSALRRVAVVPLVPGELLSPGQVGGRAGFPPAGKALVPFAVEPGGIPAGLEAGQRVAILPGSSDTGGTEPSPTSPPDGSTPASVVGTVMSVTAASADGGSAGSVVTVLLDTAAASRAAQIARPHLVVLSPTGRELP